MPLSRVELLARGLVRAQELSGNETPIVSLLDNDQLRSLDPEERVAVIKRYAQLRGPKFNYEGPSALSEVGSAAKVGVGLAFPLALLSGRLTMPTMKVLKSAKTFKAWRGIAGKMGAPIAATAAAGAVVGATAGALQHSAKSGTNKYLNALSNQIVTSQSEEEADINAAALMASTPHLARGFTNTQNIGHHYTMSNLPQAVVNLTGLSQAATSTHPTKIKDVPYWARRRFDIAKTPEYVEKHQRARIPGSQHWAPTATEDSNVLVTLPQDRQWDYVKGLGWVRNET